MVIAKPHHILVVDDSELEREAVKVWLEHKGFDVSLAADGREMRAVLATRQPDLVIIDLRLPGEDGFRLIQYLRRTQHCGIIMLTRAKATADRVRGLELGADDFISKPYQPEELVARVKSVLRRVRSNPYETVADPTPATPLYRFGPFEFDVHGRRLLDVDGREIDLTNAEFLLLSEFVSLHGTVLTRDHLVRAVHDREWRYNDRSIDILVTRLRRKLEPSPGAPRTIKSVRGVGYLFSPPVERRRR